MTIGKTIAFLSLAKTMNVPVILASGQLYSIVTALAGAERIFAMIDEEPERYEGEITFSGVKPEGKIELKNVNFSYVPGIQILYDVSLRADPGQKIAIVGSTGSGKTTITNLLNRFYEIDSGEILIDSSPVSAIDKKDLRHLIGLVMQDTHMFTGTIYDNIRFGNPGISDEACIEAAKTANAHDFITGLPDGYDTVLTNDASSLAEGQRQLLNIARAVAANTPVLILDEATSSVDPRTERLIQEGMDNLMKGRTVFVIAHRLSTVRNSDAIMVLDHGHIIERGTHDELIAEKGVYYQLYTGAFELE
jgi:ATP-binding cassette subfamily B protein